MKLCLEELMIKHPKFLCDSNLLQTLWDRLYYEPFKRDHFMSHLNEAYGQFSSMLFSMPAKSSQHSLRLTYDILLFQADILRYQNQTQSAIDLYERARKLIPENGRVYNQLAILTDFRLFHMLLAQLVDNPFKPSYMNLRKIINTKLCSNSEPSTISKLVALTLYKRFSGKSHENGREIPKILAKFDKYGDDWYGVNSLWMSLMLDPGLLDTEDPSPPVHAILRLLDFGLSRNSTSWIATLLFALTNCVVGFISKTKRFQDLWSPILSKIVQQNVDFNTNDQENLFKGIKQFKEIPDTFEDRLTKFKSELIRARLLIEDQDGNLKSIFSHEKEQKVLKTGLLLAKQKLKKELTTIDSDNSFSNLPWLIPDFHWIIDNWVEKMEPSINALSARYLITFPVLAELDFAKNRPEGQLPRSIISKFYELAGKQETIVRLQKPHEIIFEKQPKVYGGPQDAHRYRFIQAIKYFASLKNNDEQFRVLTTDPVVLASIRGLLTNE